MIKPGSITGTNVQLPVKDWQMTLASQSGVNFIYVDCSKKLDHFMLGNNLPLGNPVLFAEVVFEKNYNI